MDRSPSREQGRMMALVAALLGWMFDGFEIGMFPLVGPSALDELLQGELATNPAARDQWFGVIMAVFLVGAAAGGVAFGWLGDRIGRVRAMSLSILTYAVFTGLGGFATEAWHIAALRFIASLGIGGEWSLGVALVNELWPERSRAFIAGLIGAAANVGFLAVGLLSLGLVNFTQSLGELLIVLGIPDDTVATLLKGEGWRLLMIAGALPALLVFFIRLFVPESQRWEAANQEQKTSYWATQDLLGVIVGAIGAAIMVVLWSPLFDRLFTAELGDMAKLSLPRWLSWIRLLATATGFVLALGGFMYPVVRYLSRARAASQLTQLEQRLYLKRMLLGACLAGIPLLGTWGSFQWAPKWATALARLLPPEGVPYHAKEYTQIAASLGAIIGTILAALLGSAIGRRATYMLLCLGSFAALVYMYTANDAYGFKLLASVFVAGGVTAAFYGWFPLYMPELFPTNIRATSQGFAYNFGRVLSAVGSLQTATLTAYFARNIAAERVEVEAFPRAGAALAGIYLLGAIVIWLGPETKQQGLPD